MRGVGRRKGDRVLGSGGVLPDPRDTASPGTFNGTFTAASRPPTILTHLSNSSKIVLAVAVLRRPMGSTREEPYISVERSAMA